MPKQKKPSRGQEWRHIENKKLVYTVYFVLRLSVVLMLVAQFFNGNFDLFFSKPFPLSSQEPLSP